MELSNNNIKSGWIDYIHELQDNLCKSLEQADGGRQFHEDNWIRAEGGGGRTRIIENGDLFEKGGVNTSVVFGPVTDLMRSALKINGTSWFACGLSLVLHPLNPFVPTVHSNYRMFELYNERDEVIDRWFGGGTDLTPNYLFEDDIIHFHQSCKTVCDRFDPTFYPVFKKNCDEYFVNTHRNNERRGIGGIFYDYQRPDGTKSVDFWIDFGKACGDAFLAAYLPVAERRRHLGYTEKEKKWQGIRRGRYVEFNLVHDRGTLFGLKTNGRIESILMSLPPVARFEYDYVPIPGSEEDKLLQICLHPKDWV